VYVPLCVSFADGKSASFSTYHLLCYDNTITMSNIPKFLFHGLTFGEAKLEIVEKTAIFVLISLVKFNKIERLDYLHLVVLQQQLEVLQLNQVLIDILDLSIGILLPNSFFEVKPIL